MNPTECRACGAYIVKAGYRRCAVCRGPVHRACPNCCDPEEPARLSVIPYDYERHALRAAAGTL